MKQRLCLVVLMCVLCSGCKTLESFLKKSDPAPVLTETKPSVTTETGWVPAKTRKVWVNQHIDEDGNMVEGHYKHVILEEGHWALQEIPPGSDQAQKQDETEDTAQQ